VRAERSPCRFLSVSAAAWVWVCGCSVREREPERSGVRQPFAKRRPVRSDIQPVRSAYQPPASSTFLSERISHQQPASSTLLSEQTSTSHQAPANRTGRFSKMLRLLGNSGKPVTLETLSLTKFLRHVFQEQETHDFRKPGIVSLGFANA
jgi:hypothetical protein